MRSFKEVFKPMEGSPSFWDGTPEQRKKARVLIIIFACVCILAFISPVLGVFNYEMIMGLYVLTAVCGIAWFGYVIYCTKKNANVKKDRSKVRKM